MSRAFCLIRSEPHYRRDAFMSGLNAAGYDARTDAPAGVYPGDVLVIWNRYGATHEAATRFESAGGTVIVAENGYVKGRHDGGDYYALALHAHNGRGDWPAGDGSRWEALGIELKPWRTNGEHILVAANRSFGQPGSVMPANWPDDVAARLRKLTDREVRVRLHPGNHKPQVPLERDLENAWACVVWSSSAGVKALIEGVPVICEAPYWVCKSAAGAYVDSDMPLSSARLERQFAAYTARLSALRRLAWAQWSIAEIASGEPFHHLFRQPITVAPIAAAAAAAVAAAVAAGIIKSGVLRGAA